MLTQLYAVARVLVTRRDAFTALVWRDLTDRYLATGMGLVWTLLEPASFIFLLWLIFSNFRTMPDTGTPFLVYLSVGYAVWLYTSTVISQNSNVIRQYAFLVTKVNFPVTLLPLVKLFSLLIVHWVFLFIVFGLLIYHGYTPKLSWLQVFYYQICAMYLVLGISLIFGALNVFFKDVQETATIVLRIGFWLTPVFWSLELLPENLRSWMSLNPFFYLVDGYRRTFLFNEVFWEQENSLWFWSLSSIILLFGVLLFRQLRPYFAEVL